MKGTWARCEGSFKPAVDLEFADVGGYREVTGGRCPRCSWAGGLTKARRIWAHRELPAAERPTRIVIVPWDPDSDMAIISHDGTVVWQDWLTSIDQYLRHVAPHGVPVILEVRES